MKNKYKYSPKKLASGGYTGLISAGTNLLGNYAGNELEKQARNSDGTYDKTAYSTAEAARYGLQGAGLGASLGPVGALVGGGVGLLYGAGKGIFGTDKINSDIRSKQEQQATLDSQQAAQQAEYEAQQGKLRSQTYYSAKPINGDIGASIYREGGSIKYADGGSIHIKPSHKGRFTAYKERTGKTTEEALHSSNPHVRQMANFARNAAKWHHADGGYLNPLASDTVKAEGATHEQGGITLANNDEVEDQEIIKGNKVYSDQLKVGNKTYAEIAEKLSKKKGKFEEGLTSGNYRDRNTSERSINNIDNKLANLFDLQEASKFPVREEKRFDNGGKLDAIKVGLPTMDEGDPTLTYNPYTSTGTNSGFNYEKLAQSAIPFIDNIYNANLINQTPELPKYNSRVYEPMQALPMKTTINVGNRLADANDYYRNFETNIDQNTSSSNVARGNKAVAFATTLKNRNDIFANKENGETALVNANNQNIQNVNNANVKNKQDVDNQNLALLDNYNMNNVNRTDNILRNKSQNVAMAVNDAQKLIQDSNMKDTDEQRIMTDSLRYNDGAGYARLIGTKTMNNLINNPQYYKQIESGLKNSGQTKALDQFYKTYGKK